MESYYMLNTTKSVESIGLSSKDTASASKVTGDERIVYESKKSLYKYTSMDFIESCIKNGVYASKIDVVNDPFESAGVKYPHLYRICCLTNSPKKMLLWAYYTNHQECCVEFDVSTIDTSLLRPVEYDDTFSSHTGMSLDEVYSSLYRKGKEWKHENEFRAVYYEKNNVSSYWKKDGDCVFLRAKVKSVTFGLFSDRDLPRYKKALEILIKYEIEKKKCRLKGNKYALEDDRQFDLEIELEKVKASLRAQNEKKLPLSLNSNEEIVLRMVYDLQKDSKWVPFEKIATDSNTVTEIQTLLNKGLLVLRFQEEKGVYRFYYSLTEMGLMYIKK